MNLLGHLRLRPPRVSLCALLLKTLDVAAQSAATSMLNLHPQPTAAQRSAGNYKKGHVRFAGLEVAIETPAGSYRRPEWPPMQAHYGYVKGTEGADGDSVDVFLRPATPLDWDGEAYVIDQVNERGGFDEHKVMLGYDDQDSAVKAYLAHYPVGWQLGQVTPMSLDELKEWLSGDTSEAVAKGEWNEEDHPRDENGRFGEGSGGLYVETAARTSAGGDRTKVPKAVANFYEQVKNETDGGKAKMSAGFARMSDEQLIAFSRLSTGVSSSEQAGQGRKFVDAMHEALRTEYNKRAMSSVFQEKIRQVGKFVDTAHLLAKDWLAPTSATSGIAGYGSKKGNKSRRRVRLIAKET